MTISEQELQKYRNSGQMLAGVLYEAIVDFKMWLAKKGFINPFDYVDEKMMKEILEKLDGEQIDK